MSTISAAPNHEPELTFSAYTSAQAKAYATARPSYSPALYSEIFDFHSATGGSFDCVLDVGCGPGNATRSLAEAFSEAWGVDGSKEMINVGREIGGTTRSGNPIQYTFGGAEDVGKLEPESVDLLTSAMAAHWFDMTKFWPAVAKILKPNGTVALWNVYSMFCHPSTPNAHVVQQALKKHEYEALRPYTRKGNLLVLGGYRELVLPWMLDPPETAFNKSSFRRREWNVDGQIGQEEEFFGGQKEVTLEQLEAGLSTSSSVTRWREDNPRLAYTDRDCVKETIAEIRDALPQDVNKLTIGGSTTLLMLKKIDT